MKNKLSNTKILIAYVVKDLDIHGISNVTLNICNTIDLREFDITILCGEPINNSYRINCLRRGINVIGLPNKEDDPKGYYYHLFEQLKYCKPDIVHVHGNSAMMLVDLLIAKLAGIRHRIAHCHSTSCSHKTGHIILKPFVKFFCTYGIACSDEAGKWLFGRSEYDVIQNGFDIDHFTFNNDIRREVRKQLNMDCKYIIGHVGTFSDVKNQSFLVNILPDLLKKNKDIILILIGSGPFISNIKELATEKKCIDNILFLENVSDASRYYNAMDMYLFPSKYEGFGISLLEAQINGLYCISSDTIPDVTNVSGKVCRLPLDRPDLWINEILCKKGNCYRILKDELCLFREYDVNTMVTKLENIYHTII